MVLHTHTHTKLHTHTLSLKSILIFTKGNQGDFLGEHIVLVSKRSVEVALFIRERQIPFE